MHIKTINRLVGFGILIFIVGTFAGVFRISYLSWLVHLGSVLTFTGIFFFFKDTNLSQQFRKDPKDDSLTYFWNVIVLKLWTAMFAMWMIAKYLEILFPNNVHVNP